MGARARGWLGACERRRHPDRRGAAPRAAPPRDARATRRSARRRARARRGASDDDRRARLHRLERRTCSPGRRTLATVKLRILTHAERDLRGTLPDLWPEFMTHDPVANAFWPRLYELFPDFQFWIVDGRNTVGYACT